ncbi:MAG: UDP-N-acetylglucosamine 2-epimerase (non-hydrolyzing) [Acidobacteriia bacterium]|nr:UDP-N-acetylglucosamine 2-epimerase (non-hydrolyzing) [Terriglobia bacterium]
MPVELVMVAGARPNFMKVAPLWNALSQDSAFSTTLVHTGQHFDDSMSGQFFRDLGLPEPAYHLGAGGGSHAQQTAEIMKRLEPVLLERSPRGVIVVGDVNSTVAGALVAKKLGIDVVHAEGGLRSFDRTMPEEINRLVTDAISDVLLVTERSGVDNLTREGVPPERIHLVGNLMIDSLRKHLPRAMQSDVRHRLGIGGERYGLVTLHRPANVDDERQRAEILGALSVISEDLELFWPVHPRTRARLEQGSRALPPRIHLLDPLGYLDFLRLQAESFIVLTDSGGIQEETTVLGVPCLTLRENTERPVTIECGTNRLAGVSKDSILQAWRTALLAPPKSVLPPLWDGKAGERCHAVLSSYFQSSKTPDQ